MRITKIMLTKTKCIICTLHEVQAEALQAKTRNKSHFWRLREIALYERIVTLKSTYSLHACNVEHHEEAIKIRSAVKKLDAKEYKRRLQVLLSTIDLHVDIVNEIRIKRKLGLPSARLETELRRINFLLAQRSRRLRELGPQDADSKAFVDQMVLRTLSQDGFLTQISLDTHTNKDVS